MDFRRQNLTSADAARLNQSRIRSTSSFVANEQSILTENRHLQVTNLYMSINIICAHNPINVYKITFMVII